MASQKQTDANRENAQRSTGPRTAEGKRASCRNALRHGLCAKIVSLPESDQVEFKTVVETVEQELAPGGQFEALLVDEIATGLWRIRRALQIEAEVFAYLSGDIRVRQLRNDYDRAWGARLDSGNVMSDPADLKPLRQAADDAEHQRDAEAPLALAFLHGDHVIERLLRYRSAAEKSAYRAIEQLRRSRESGSTTRIPPGLTAALDDVAATTATGMPPDPLVTDEPATGAEAEPLETRGPAMKPEEEAIMRNEPN